MAATDVLLERVIAYAAAEGITDKSLREIASGVGTSHRMLLYHFGSREGLLAAIVGAVEVQQREVLASLTREPDGTATDVMLRLWKQVSDPTLRPFVRLFFATVGLAVQGTPGTQALLGGLTNPWLEEGAAAAERLGMPVDPAAMRLSVAVSRGLLLELVAGADPAAVDASYQLFVDMWRHWADVRSSPAEQT
jgi:AcrR family transcriptional regulator